MNNQLLAGQCAVITGASRGIGAAIAELFAAEGASLVLTELPARMDGLQALADTLRSEYGIEVLALPLDLCRVEEIPEVVKRAEERFERLDILINNAGVNHLAPALEVTPADWDMVVDINLKGTFFFTQAVARNMIAHHGGSVVMISSQHGVVANEMRAPYCASKAGLLNLAKSLALEWARHGIRVNAVAPTFVRTEESEVFLQDPYFLRQNLPKIPLRKFAEASDVAEACLYLASAKAGIITGHTLVLDGGWTAQ